MTKVHAIFICLINSFLLNASMMNEDGVFVSNRDKRAAAKLKSVLWPNATVPYIVDFQFSEKERKVLLEIFDDWSRDSCIRFVEWDGKEKYFIFFQAESTQLCYSYTGVQIHQPMPQRVFVNHRCFTKAYRRQFSHEIGHLLGFFHEHNRPDRDRFIDIIWENIEESKKHQFIKRNKANIVSFGSPYDFGSIMQYPLDYYSKEAGKYTMVEKVNYGGPIGKNTKPSESDIQQLQYLYGCKEYVPGSGEDGSGDLGYVEYTGQLDSASVTPFPTSSHVALSTANSLLLIQPTSTIKPVTTSAIHYLNATNNSSSIFMNRPITTTTTVPMPSYTETTQSTRKLNLPHTTIISSPSVLSSSSRETVNSVTSTLNKVPVPSGEPILTTGQPIGLRTQHSPKVGRNYWLTCTTKICRPRLCPGKTFDTEKQKKCTDSMFTFMEPREQLLSPVLVGDVVVLLPYHSTESIVSCEKQFCRTNHLCFSESGSFRPYCENQVLSIFVSGKENGDVIVDGDLIELRHFISSDHNTAATTWIGCDPLNTRKCKKHTCSKNVGCNYEKFELHVL